MDELKGKKVAIFVADGFEDLEFFYPLIRLTEAGAEVVTASPGGRPVSSKHGIRFSPSRSIQEILKDEFDCIIIPGGKAPEKLRKDPQVLELVRKHAESGSIIAAICHGPQVLVSADLVKGRTLTSYRTVKDEIEASGGRFVDTQVARDGNLITSRSPEDLPFFSRAIIQAISGEAEGE